MGEQRIIAEICTYDEFLLAVKSWIRRCGISYETAGAISGLQDGYLGTLLASTPARSFSRMSLNATLSALALRLLLVVDEERLRQMQPRFTPRRKNAVSGMHSRKKPGFSLFKGNPELAKALHARWMLQSSARTRRRIAKAAAMARWRNGARHEDEATEVR
jgi:hypothetical protein